MVARDLGGLTTEKATKVVPGKAELLGGCQLERYSRSNVRWECIEVLLRKIKLPIHPRPTRGNEDILSLVLVVFVRLGFNQNLVHLLKYGIHRRITSNSRKANRLVKQRTEVGLPKIDLPLPYLLMLHGVLSGGGGKRELLVSLIN